ncbi:MAG: hypothetical protein WC789_12425 [Lentisphaeria bacterium]|jgi:hypothetical protein
MTRIGQPGFSRLVLDEAGCVALARWALARAPQRLFRRASIRHEDDHWHVTLHGFDLGWYCPAYDLEFDLHVTLVRRGTALALRLAAHGWTGLAQKAVGNLALRLWPRLATAKGVTVKDAGAGEVDLELAQCHFRLPDGRGGVARRPLTEWVRFQALRIGATPREALLLEFALKD